VQRDRAIRVGLAAHDQAPGARRALAVDDRPGGVDRRPRQLAARDAIAPLEVDRRAPHVAHGRDAEREQDREILGAREVNMRVDQHGHQGAPAAVDLGLLLGLGLARRAMAAGLRALTYPRREPSPSETRPRDGHDWDLDVDLGNWAASGDFLLVQVGARGELVELTNANLGLWEVLLGFDYLLHR
jgi:hypothetical protein